MAVANGTSNGIEVRTKDQIDLGDSATQDDAWKSGGLTGGVFNFYMGNQYAGWGADSNQLLPDLPPTGWSRLRDQVLASTPRYEPFWNGAVKKAIAKGVTQQSDLKYKERNKPAAERLQELFKASNGRRGFKHFLNQHLQDYFLTDNGAFIEIDRENNKQPGSRIIGLYHLDSLRCYRTGDPDRPVIYQDLRGKFHYLTWWQVWDISDTPNARNIYYGVGDCAAGGAYERIRRMVAIRLYEYQKMIGASPKALYFIQGMTQQSLEEALKANEASRMARRMTVYGGAAITASMSKENLDIKNIPIASLPDNYKQDEEIEQAAVEYSNVLGVSKQDLKPLMGRMAGTATQSDVLDGQSESSGLGLWSGAFEDFINEMVAPSTVTFFWAFNNTRQQKAKADVASAFVTAASGMVSGGILLPDKAANWLVDMDVLDPSYLAAPDISDTNILAEDDKPDVVNPDDNPDQVQEQNQPPAGAAPAGQAPSKADAIVAQAAQVLGM
jgi:hypothetical protein